MAAVSKNKYDALRWVEKSIDTLNNYSQVPQARKLIRCFVKRYYVDISSFEFEEMVMQKVLLNLRLSDKAKSLSK